MNLLIRSQMLYPIELRVLEAGVTFAQKHLGASALSLPEAHLPKDVILRLKFVAQLRGAKKLAITLPLASLEDSLNHLCILEPSGPEWTRVVLNSRCVRTALTSDEPPNP